MNQEDKDYLWQHFHFNAEQRLKAFHFFVVVSVFADGLFIAALDKNLPAAAYVLTGTLLAALAAAFLAIDIRSKELLNLAVPGLKAYEQLLPKHARVFHIDSQKRKLSARYTVAFRALMILQLVFGLGVIVFGIWKSLS
jgi:hypothetical protein